MEWLIETLRVLREVRDWTDTRSLDRKRRIETREAVHQAVATAEAALNPPGPPKVRPLGPARPRGASGTAPAGGPPRRSTAGQTADRQAIPLNQIDPQALSAIRRLRRYGFRAYLVGGCVRDLLLGVTPKDFDVATDARPEEVKSLFRNSRIIGRRFRLVHLYYRAGKVIEVSTFRANITSDDDDDDLLIRRDNVFGSEEEDARRRDFTINGLFYDVGTGRIIDHVGGMVDVRQRYLRMIGDPDIRLREDPVRILRAIRFAAKLDVKMDPDLNAAIRANRGEIGKCAPARVMEETFRLLRIGHAERTVELMDELGVLPVLLPEIRAFLDGHIPGVDRPVREEELPANAALFTRHLRELDRMVRTRNVADEVVLGALLYTPLMRALDYDDDPSRDRNRVMTTFLANIGGRINLTRRLSENLRQIFIAQRSLQPSGTLGSRRRRRRRVNATALIRKPFFDDAVDLLEIHLRALELPTDIVDGWRERAESVAAGRPINGVPMEAANGLREDENGVDEGPAAKTSAAGESGGRGRRKRRRPRRKKANSDDGASSPQPEESA